MSGNMISMIIGLFYAAIGVLLIMIINDIVKRKVENVIITIDSFKLWMLNKLVMIQGNYTAILNQHSRTIEALEAFGKYIAITDNRMEKITDILDSINNDLNRYGDILDSVSKENNMLVAEVRSWATSTGCDGDACDINFEENNEL